MRWLPASLAARTVLLVVAVVVVAEIATFSLIFKNRSSTHLGQITRSIAGQVRLLQNVLPELNNEARKRLANTEIGEPGMQLRPDGDFVPKYEPSFGFAHYLAADLEREIGQPIVLRDAGLRSRSGLWIGFMVGNERWWLVLPPPRFEPQDLPPDLWGWLAATLAILMLIAGLFVRSIIGPLARLGAAVAATGDGKARTVLPDGPKEVWRLAEQHNIMVGQLTAADAERREMLAGLTHDLRAPLARLRVRLALLESDAERCGLTRDAEDMERIVDHCLAFLRSEENAPQAPMPLLLADAVSDEVARHRELGRPLEMAVSTAAAACQVAIAHGSLQRLLDNLIDNAMQYGAPPIALSLAVDRPGTVSLRVSDHGSGIAPDQRARALEAFAQIDPARATGGSCGLGLAIVRRIVTGCGGDVKLTEAPGGGLEVVLVFPVRS